MSGYLTTLTSGELARTPEEELASQKESAKLLGWLPNVGLANVASLAWPDRQLPGFLANVPLAGAPEAMIGLGDFAWQHAANAAKKGFGLNLPPSPEWMQKAGEHFQDTYEGLKEDVEKYSGGVLPQPDMNTTTGQLADFTGRAVTSGIGLGPAVISNTVARALPTGLKTIGRMAVAPISTAPLAHQASIIAANTALGTAQASVDTLGSPAQAATTPEFTPYYDPTLPVPPIPPDKPPVQESATPVAASTAAANLTITPATPQQPSSLSELAQTSGQPSSLSELAQGHAEAPTFVQQGVSDHTIGQSLASIAIAAASIAGGVRLYRRGAEMTAQGRAARINDPAFAARVNDYQNEVIARGSGSGTIIPPGGEAQTNLMPNGNVVRRASVYTADKLVNDAAREQDYIRLTSDNPGVAERLASAVGNMHDTQLQGNKTRLFLSTGHDRDSNLSIPNPVKMMNDHAALTADERATWNQGIAAKDEIENRLKNAREFKAANPTGTPTDNDIHHNFIGKSTEELHSLVRDMESNPKLLELAQRYWNTNSGMVDIGNHSAWKFFSDQEKRDLQSTRRYRVPQLDVDGNLMNPIAPRDTRAFTGKAQLTDNPMQAMGLHIEELYKRFASERLNQQLMDHFQEFQRQPGAPKSITEVSNPTGIHTNYYSTPGMGVEGMARDPIITLRNNGVKHYRVDDKEQFNTLRSNSMSDKRVRMDALAHMVRMWQKGTTGMASLATGRGSFIRNNLYSSMAGAVNMTPKGYAGRADRFVKRRTGLDTSLARSVDMFANVPGGVARYGIGAGDRFIKRFADVFHPTADNIWNQKMRALDPVMTDAMHQMAEGRWQRSNTKWLEDMGMSGHGSALTIDAPSVVTGKRAGYRGENTVGLRSEMARLAPDAYFSGKWMGAKPIVIKLHNALGSVYSHLNDAALQDLAVINRHNPNFDPERLTYEMRNIVGNPARTGSGTTLGIAKSLMPYVNVSGQSVARFSRAFGERPMGTPMTLAMGLGTAAALTLLTHMRSPAHMDWLQNALSLQQRESNIALALNDDPNKPTMLTLEQGLRAPYAFMLDAMSKAINIIGARHDPNVFNAVWDGLSSFLSSHVTNSNMDAILHSAVDELGILNLPELIGKIDYNALLHGKGLTDATRGPIGPDGKPPPGQAFDSLMDGKNGQVFEDLMTSTIGAMAHALVSLPNHMLRYHAQGHSWYESAGMSGRDWLQNTREANPSLNNIVMETPMRLSINPPIAEALQPSLYALKHIPAVPNQANVGYTSGNYSRLPVPISENAAVSSDPLIRQMLQSAHGWSSRIDEAMKPIQDIKIQMQTVDKYGMDPQKRREWLNEQTRVMADKYKLVDAYVHDLDWTMSKLAGKNIRLQDIDWQKGPEQFTDQ